MATLLLIGLGLLGVPALCGVFKLQSREDESRIINAHWLSDKDKFHLISRWGTQH